MRLPTRATSLFTATRARVLVRHRCESGDGERGDCGGETQGEREDPRKNPVGCRGARGGAYEQHEPRSDNHWSDAHLEPRTDLEARRPDLAGQEEHDNGDGKRATPDSSGE